MTAGDMKIEKYPINKEIFVTMVPDFFKGRPKVDLGSQNFFIFFMNKGKTFRKITRIYADLTRKYFGTATFVFEGYHKK